MVETSEINGLYDQEYNAKTKAKTKKQKKKFHFFLT